MTRMIIGLAGMLLLGVSTCGAASAAGAGGPTSRGVAPVQGFHRGGVAPRFVGLHRDGHRGLRRLAPRWTWGGYPAPWLWSAPGAASLALIVPPAAPPVDRDSFENLEARAGIRRGPAPEPTIYRLEGPRRNPAARVIRIAGADEGSPRRSRFAHAETGALMLTVPGR